MLTTQQRRKNLPQFPPNRRTDRAPNSPDYQAPQSFDPVPP